MHLYSPPSARQPCVQAATLSRVLHDLQRIAGPEAVVAPPPAWALRDATEWAGVTGRADALVRPPEPEAVAAVVAWCAERGVPVTPRGGGTGFAGGAVPDGGVVLALDRLDAIGAVSIEGRCVRVGAGVTTATVRRLARESGLIFGPDPGAMETSQIGGNIATNAGGPHSLRHGPIRRWLLDVEAVLPDGALVRTGRGLPRESAGYDLAALLCGSEGTLGVVTAATLRLEPAPEAVWTVAAAYPDARAGGEAVLTALASGVPLAALDFLDAPAAAAAHPPFALEPGGFVLLVEIEGTQDAVAAARDDLRSALAPGAVAEVEGRELWRWRESVAHAVAAQRGGKLSDDIAVPVSRLAEMVEGTIAIGERHRLPACSWGHAADGVVHASLLIDRDAPEEVERARAAAEDLFDLALALGGTLSGEHGLGRLKRHRAGDLHAPGVLQALRAIKAALDPAGIMNPGVGAA